MLDQMVQAISYAMEIVTVALAAVLLMFFRSDWER